MATMPGSVTFEVVLRLKSRPSVEEVVGEVTVPVSYDADESSHIDPDDIERALGSIGDEVRQRDAHPAPRSRRRARLHRRRRQWEAGR